MTKNKETMKPLKIYRLIMEGLEDKITKKDKQQINDDYDLLMNKYQYLSKNYSKELLIETIQFYPIFLKAFNKLKVAEKEKYLEYIDEYIMEEVFFGKYLEKFNGYLHATALYAKTRSILYINGLYCRHFSEPNFRQNMVYNFMRSTSLPLNQCLEISDSQDVYDFLDNPDNKPPKWLKDFPDIQELLTIPEIPKKKV